MGVPIVGSMMKKVFGTRNERMVKNYLRLVDGVSAQESSVRTLSDDELRAKTEAFRERIANGASAKDMLDEIFAVAREAMDRSVGIRNIFNPEHRFDPSRLPEHLQSVYAETKAAMDAAEPSPPTGALLGHTEPVPAWVTMPVPTELYDAVRELYPESRPPFRSRPFDVQIIGAMVLSEGNIAEMKTGEGKTIVAPLASYLAAVEKRQVHVVTVNDYLVQRDRDWVAPFFHALGLTVGAIHPQHMQPPQLKKAMYTCDIVYGTTSEFGFDYLRDNMKNSVEEQVQKNREFAIVDEVDSVLIDEARTPLIISGPAHQEMPRYDVADRIARELVTKQAKWNEADDHVQKCLDEISACNGEIRTARDKSSIPEIKRRMEAAQSMLSDLEAERDKHTQYYEVELDKKRASLTHEGIEEAQRSAGLGSFYVGDNIDLPHLLEQAIRAHTVYVRDKDYVVAPNDRGTQGIVIVDQNTGRKMPGRQWSDGLHQAIEAKEGVTINEETQTMATITVQNFFKMYDRLSGMTGTADTEATEFHEIYSLDVVVIPTNVPIARFDWDDVVYMSEKDKWSAIVDEIKRFHDVGRPILVGTTSVEKSELLSQMLTKRHHIKHEVLNAKNHEREAEIVALAGSLGAVTIATNMAGRGTDIKLQPFTRADLVDHWRRRSIASKDVKPEQSDDEIVAGAHRYLATKELGLKQAEVDAMDPATVRSQLLQHWAVELAMISESKAASMSDDQLRDLLDSTGTSARHRLQVYDNTEAMGGLHVIGTERHDSRRIDYQLRGRSGRQGDNGSSRFYLSLDDELMKLFASETMRKMLSRLGMKEGDAIEHSMLTKSIGRAQRKVEERNFLNRKNLIEYNEATDLQRQSFYRMRQGVLEGRGIKEIIFDNIEDAVNDAAFHYLRGGYVPNCIADWVEEHLNVRVEPDRLKGKDQEDLVAFVAIEAKEEAAGLINLTMGEYMSDDSDPSEWDYKSFADWANQNFDAGVHIAELQEMSRREIFDRVERAASKRIDSIDLSPLDQFLVRQYGERELCAWAKNKFNVEFDPEQFADLESPQEAADIVLEKAREIYDERETRYGIEFALDMTTAKMQHGPEVANQAITEFCAWVNSRFGLGWEPTSLPSSDPRQLYQLLVDERKTWDDAKFAERARTAVAAGSSPEDLQRWCEENLRARLTDDQLERAEDDPQGVMEEKLKETMRAELTHFERWVTLQIIDEAWKDHLHHVDQLQSAIGFRSFSQKDPRIEFKKECARLFDEMHERVRDKTTDLIFKAKLTPQVSAPDPAQVQAQAQAQAQAAARAQAQAAAQAADAAPAQPAAAARPQRAPRRAAPVAPTAPVIGRNEVVTIFNPATGEKESLKFKKAKAKLEDGWRLVRE